MTHTHKNSAEQSRPHRGALAVTPHGETAYSPSSILRALTKNPLDVDVLRESDTAHPHESIPHTRTSTLLAGVLALLLGLGVGIAVVDQRSTSAAESAQRQALVDAVEERRGAEQAAADRGDDLRREIRDAEEELAAAGAGSAGEELATVGAGAGTVEMHGPGAVIVLSDSAPLAPSPGEDATVINRVTDSDLQAAVNALWQSGAEAIALNGVPITGQTAIRTAGSAILVNLRPVSPPYRIEAIGNSTAMLENFARTQDGQDLMEISSRYGILMEQSSADAITVPGGSAVLRHAHPVDPAATAMSAPQTLGSRKEES